MYSERKKSCITFQTNAIYHTSKCEDYISTNDKTILTLICTIKDMIRIKIDRCQSNYRHRHIALIFLNNFIFEIFFKDNHNVIQNLFKHKKFTDKISLDITINDHNVTEITWNYINSTLKIDSKVYTNLRLFIDETYKKRLQPKIGNDFYHENIPFIQLYIRCDDDEKQKIYYRLKSQSRKISKYSNCKSYCTSYISKNVRICNNKVRNRTYHGTVTLRKPTISTIEELELLPIELTEKYPITTELVDVSEVTLKLSTTHTLDISVSSTESSRRSNILLFVYFLPSIFVFLTCVILATIHITLRFHRLYKQDNITEQQDSSIKSSISLESMTFRRLKN